MGRRTVLPADVDLSRTWGTVLNDRRLLDRYLGRGVCGARFLKRFEYRLGTSKFDLQTGASKFDLQTGVPAGGHTA